MTPDVGEPRRLKSEEVMPSTDIQSFNRISGAGTFRSFILLVLEIRQKNYIYQIFCLREMGESNLASNWNHPGPK